MNISSVLNVTPQYTDQWDNWTQTTGRSSISVEEIQLSNFSNLFSPMTITYDFSQIPNFEKFMFIMMRATDFLNFQSI